MEKLLIIKARKRLLQMHYESGVGHIGGNLSSLDVLLSIFNRFKFDKDILILSKGHSAGALYVALWAFGKISDEELKSFHKDNTRLSGHPPCNLIPEVIFATGSLGHGLSLAAGTALAKKLKQEGGHVYCLLSDGECQEGSTWEAFIFIAHHQLLNITMLIDNNGLQGFGAVKEISSMNLLREKLGGFPFQFFEVSGHDYSDISAALQEKSFNPKLIILKTVKGNGVSFMENQMEWHYLPMNAEQYKLAISEVEGL